MAKLNENYEAVVIFSMKQGEESIKESVEKFASLISENGTLESTDEWGKRALAYEINDEAEGYYVLYTFNSAPSFPREFERRLRIADGVLRSLVVTRV
jgi:small subunit ribosomal protein S6